LREVLHFVQGDRVRDESLLRLFDD
jgi:hypothetical protein